MSRFEEDRGPVHVTEAESNFPNTWDWMKNFADHKNILYMHVCMRICFLLQLHDPISMSDKLKRYEINLIHQTHVKYIICLIVQIEFDLQVRMKHKQNRGRFESEQQTQLPISRSDSLRWQIQGHFLALFCTNQIPPIILCCMKMSKLQCQPLSLLSYFLFQVLQFYRSIISHLCFIWEVSSTHIAEDGHQYKYNEAHRYHNTNTNTQLREGPLKFTLALMAITLLIIRRLQAWHAGGGWYGITG